MVYDIAVIGGGPGGYSAALEAVKYGLSVVLFEKNLLGGTCLNRGCVPTKFLIHTAEMYRRTRDLSSLGITASDVKIDLLKAQQENISVMDKLRSGLEQLLSDEKIKVICSECTSILSENTVASESEIYNVKNIIIATGSAPVQPFVSGAVTSDELLKTEVVPERLTIIGGGVIAVEFAWLFNNLGSNVKIRIRGDRILRKLDKELAVGTQQLLKKHGIFIETKCSPEALAENNADVILSAAGRIPVLPVFGDVSPETGEDGGIVVNEFCRTSVAGIYAVGDVISGSTQLAHVAMEQGRRAVQHIAGAEIDKASAVISCIYTEPEIASVGLTEAKAKEMGIKYMSAKQIMSSNARTLISNPERGFVKLISDTDSGKLIGAQLMCERASDIVSELALAINSGLTVDDLCQSAHPHPSFCEAVYEAAAVLRNKMKNIEAKK